MLARRQRLMNRPFSNGNIRIPPSLLFGGKCRQNGLGYNRFGVIISVKIDKRSSARHKIKRRFLAQVVKWPPVGYDFLFIAHLPIKAASQEDLKMELNQVWQLIISSLKPTINNNH